MAEKRKTVTSVYLPEDQAVELDRLSKELMVTKAALIRKGVDWVIDWAQDRVDILKEADQL